ncbi:SKP1-like protein [Trifolium medium]|uniref:SKP1-like protein n=1 Tax=Trifolium medium TaxID=97028 RepID=A0A392PMF2_9FABA|nr:SKP1-like protein [Trifolium medium]
MPFGFNFDLFNLFLFNLYNVRKANAPRRRNVITFEEGLKTLKEGIVKLFNILEGSEPNFTSEEHIMLYTCCNAAVAA